VRERGREREKGRERERERGWERVSDDDESEGGGRKRIR